MLFCGYVLPHTLSGYPSFEAAIIRATKIRKECAMLYAMKKVRALLIVFLLVVGIPFFLSCVGDGEDNSVKNGNDNGDNNKVQTAKLPVLRVGDTWTWKTISPGNEGNRFLKITGEEIIDGKAVYVADSSWDLRTGRGKGTEKIDKETMATIRIQQSGEMHNFAFTIDDKYSYKFSNMPFPYSVGKTWKVKKDNSTVISIMGEPQHSSESNDYVYKISNVESVKVSAGTFECYKILEYDSKNTLQANYWYSVKVKKNVKEADYKTKQIAELISYSVAD